MVDNPFSQLCLCKRHNFRHVEQCIWICPDLLVFVGQSLKSSRVGTKQASVDPSTVKSFTREGAASGENSPTQNKLAANVSAAARLSAVFALPPLPRLSLPCRSLDASVYTTVSKMLLPVVEPILNSAPARRVSRILSYFKLTRMGVAKRALRTVDFFKKNQEWQQCPGQPFEPIIDGRIKWCQDLSCRIRPTVFRWTFSVVSANSSRGSSIDSWPISLTGFMSKYFKQRGSK